LNRKVRDAGKNGTGGTNYERLHLMQPFFLRAYFLCVRCPHSL
jgi:hypothetical protein